ncbi:tyrosine-type recombinase/integrase [Microbacterium oleivorans]|uniref:tyrosine-type recombinase/integrase n=1 Tax=Microbacterium TaxID=33882 RepID=UPI0033E0D73A
MGSVTPYESAHGRRYRVRYRKPDHSQTDKRGFRTKREAELFLASVEIDKARGGYIDPGRARVTIAQWMDIWLASRSDIRATTHARIESIISKHVKPQLGHVALGDLTRLGVQQWASKLPGEPATVRKIVLVLSGALTLAVEDGRISYNPAASLRLARTVQKRKRYLSHTQVGQLAHAVGEQPHGADLGYDILVLVLAYCGLRWGELSGLRVKDVDLERGRLNVAVTVVMVKGYQREEAPKDYEHRSIPVPAFLVPHLARQIAGRKPSDPVFYGQRTGTWLRNAVFRIGWFDDAATSIDLDRLTPHELRHTAASLAISAGANVKAVQRMLGHAKASVTLDVYADLFEEDLDAVAVSLNSAALHTAVGELYGATASEK